MGEENEVRIYFVGPLGLWAWPLVNLILAIVERIRSAPRTPFVAVPARSVGKASTLRYDPYAFRGEKIYEVVRDEKGRIMKIIER